MYFINALIRTFNRQRQQPKDKVPRCTHEILGNWTIWFILIRINYFKCFWAGLKIPICQWKFYIFSYSNIMRREGETAILFFFYMYVYCAIWYFYAIFHFTFKILKKIMNTCVILIMEFTWVTCDRVNDCRACRGLDIQYCINTLLALAASFIWESHICPNVRFVLRAVILSNWTFNQSWNIENIPIITKSYVSVVHGPKQYHHCVHCLLVHTLQDPR